MEDGQLKVFGGTGNPRLAERIAKYLDCRLGQAHVSRFADSELFVKLDDDVRGRDVFLVQSTCGMVNENLMELLIFIDCLRRASARRITAVIPYFGYARQDRKEEGRVPITAKLVANLLSTAGADRALTMDLHAAQIQGFFDIPVDHLLAEPVLSEYLLDTVASDITLISPDVGNIKRARRYANRLKGEFAIIDKRRVNHTDTMVDHIIGDIERMNVLMIDDMIATAGTVCQAAVVVKDHGAKTIRVGATHAVLCGPACERINDAPIDELIVTDTIPIPEAVKDKLRVPLTVLSVADLLGEAIYRIHRHESVSSLFLKDS